MKTLVALGDSITAGWPYTKDYSWVDCIKKNSDNLKVINAGISGDTFRDMLSRIDKDVLVHKPDYCIVMGGTNEAYQKISQSVLKENFLKIMGRLRSIDCEVIIGLPLAVEDSEMELYLRDIREWYIDYCSRNNIRTINFHKFLLDAEGKTINYSLTVDGCHPNKEGYKIMGQVVLDYLKMFNMINL